MTKTLKEALGILNESIIVMSDSNRDNIDMVVAAMRDVHTAWYFEQKVGMAEATDEKTDAPVATLGKYVRGFYWALYTPDKSNDSLPVYISENQMVYLNDSAYPLSSFVILERIEKPKNPTMISPLHPVYEAGNYIAMYQHSNMEEPIRIDANQRVYRVGYNIGYQIQEFLVIRRI